MSCVARTILIDIHLSGSDDAAQLRLLEILDDQLEQLGLTRVSFAHRLASSQLFVYVSDNDLSGSLRIYPSNKLATLTLEESSVQQAMSNEDVECFRKQLQKALETRVVRVPHLKRGARVQNYYTSADERLLEYDFDEVLFERESDFQEVKILKSPTLGAVLFLDDLQNLGECDLPYTHGIMNFGSYSYKDRDILILGGGDGGLLFELLKEKPKHVTMIDIDDTVMKSCRKYLRGACGDCLDTFDGPNYNVIVGDCLEHMERYKKQGRTFDVVFSDLTDIPISADGDTLTRQSDQWEFLRKVVTDSLSIMKVGAVFQNHAIGKGCLTALQGYEKFLKTLTGTHFTKRCRFVPSFLEEWVFYSIYKDV